MTTETSIPGQFSRKTSETGPAPHRGTRLHWKLLVTGGVLIAAIGYLVMAATGSSAVYYVSVSELQQSDTTLSGRPVRLGGEVSPGSVRREGRDLQFSIVDGDATLPVRFGGIVPDIFQEGIIVVVEGRLDPDGTFAASNLLAKCPSRFES
ncbi:MAG: cytochrome c maturation protein CcmE [Chloroflexi bacterium]|nr:cytochrome c maturation protein CcmE [Chloroflexota bacterium]